MKEQHPPPFGIPHLAVTSRFVIISWPALGWLVLAIELTRLIAK